jgi:phosphoserine phosphatase
MRQFLFDYDGTLTRKELLPEIGRACDLEEEIAHLTALTIAGHVPFEKSLEHRVKMLSRVPISVVQSIVNDIPVYEEIAAFISDNPERCHIVTGNLDVWVGAACGKITKSLFCSHAIHKEDRILGLKRILDKTEVARLFDGPIVAIGEGHADAGMIEIAEVGVAFGQTHEPARSVIEVCSHLIYDERRLCRFLRQLL